MDLDLNILSSLDFRAVMTTVALSTLAVWLLVRKPLGVPPGPRWRTPILGNLREFASHFGLKATLKGLRSTYGDIYNLYLGRHLVVIVSGREGICKLLKKDEKLLERTDILGEISTSGNAISKANVIRFNQTMEKVLDKPYSPQENCPISMDHFIRILTERKDRTFDPAGPISRNVAILVWSVIWDENDSDDGKSKLQMAYLCDELSNLRGQEVLMRLVPILRYLPGERGRCERIDGIRAGIRYMFKNEMEESRSDLGWRDDDVLATYLGLVKTEGDRHSMEDSKLCELLVTAYINLTRSLTTMVYSAVWYLMMNPDLQEQVYTELSLSRATRGQSRDYSNRRGNNNARDVQEHSLTEAFILETKRFVKMNSLLGYSRRATGEARLLGGAIPKGTLILADVESLMTDMTVWSDPFEFQPARFLTADGHVARNTYGLQFIRGDDAAYMDTFVERATQQYITAILQNFSIEKPANVQQERHDKNSRFTACFVPRGSIM